MKFIWSQKFCYNNDKEKRVVQGKRTKNDETIHKYIEEFFSEVWHSNTKFIWSQRLSYKERREDT